MLAAWALAAASVQLVQRRPGVLDATHATQDACARAARGKKAAERRRRVDCATAHAFSDFSKYNQTYVNTALVGSLARSFVG